MQHNRYCYWLLVSTMNYHNYCILSEFSFFSHSHIGINTVSWKFGFLFFYLRLSITDSVDGCVLYTHPPLKHSSNLMPTIPLHHLNTLTIPDPGRKKLQKKTMKAKLTNQT